MVDIEHEDARAIKHAQCDFEKSVIWFGEYDVKDDGLWSSPHLPQRSDVVPFIRVDLFTPHYSIDSNLDQQSTIAQCMS